MRVSDKEWQVLEALWPHPAGLPLGDVVEALRTETGWSRNTVLTYLTRMEAKGLVAICKEGTPHRYAAAVSREDCAAQERQSLLSRVYRGLPGDGLPQGGAADGGGAGGPAEAAGRHGGLTLPFLDTGGIL